LKFLLILLNVGVAMLSALLKFFTPISSALKEVSSWNYIKTLFSVLVQHNFLMQDADSVEVASADFPSRDSAFDSDQQSGKVRRNFRQLAAGADQRDYGRRHHREPYFSFSGSSSGQPDFKGSSPFTSASKRVVDLAASIVLLTLFAPIMLVISISIWWDDPGPVIYRQERIGAFGTRFTMLKFRSMGQTAVFCQATIDDPRVTTIGRFLRRTSLDELPQLINVIKGDMSLVGPRPHAPETMVEGLPFEQALEFYLERYRVKPGITGLAQIRGQRGETKAIKDLRDRVSSDLEYVNNWSFWLDISILVRTIPTLFTQVNAY